MSNQAALAIRNHVLSAPSLARLAQTLPKNVDPSRFAHGVLTAIQKTPKLTQCSLQSLWLATVEAAHLGLPIDATGGHAYLVPYKGSVKLIVGYKGMIYLAVQSGAADSIDAYVVYENDEFDFALGSEPFVKHVPSLDDPGKIKAAYAIARLPGGGIKIEVMSYKQLMAIKARSQARSGPWTTDEAEMCRKTPVRKLSKYLAGRYPMTDKLQRAVNLDEATDAGLPQDLGAGLDPEILEVELAEDGVPIPEGLGGEG